MSREEIIQLMDLLTLYIDECKAERKPIGQCKTRNEFATQLMISDHIRISEQIKEVLCFKL